MLKLNAIDLPVNLVSVVLLIFDAGFLCFCCVPDCIDDCDAVSSANALFCLFHVAHMAFCICGHCGPHRGRRGASFLVEVVRGHFSNIAFCNIGLFHIPLSYVLDKVQV